MKRPNKIADPGAAAYRIPAELTGYIPRRVRLSVAGRAFAGLMLLLVIAGAAGGILLYIAADRGRAKNVALESSGLTSEATVVSVEREADEEHRRLVRYHYNVGGQEYAGSVRLRRREADGIEVGSKVTVRYLNAEPGRSWMAGHGPQGPPLWTVAFVPAITLLVVTFMALLLRDQLRLLAEGRPAHAVVIKTSRAHHTHNHHSFKVECEFQDLSGAKRTVKLETSRKPANGNVTVLYDRDNPRKAVMYPLPLARVDTRK